MKHYFVTPQDVPYDRFCAECDEYVTDSNHIKLCEICRINESEIEDTLYDVSVWSCQHCTDTRPGDIREKLSLKYERRPTTLCSNPNCDYLNATEICTKCGWITSKEIHNENIRKPD